MENQLNFGGVGLGLLKFCLQHSDASPTDPALSGRDPADYEWLKAALGNLDSDVEKMKKLIKKLKEIEEEEGDRSQKDEKVALVLEGLQYFVEDLDLANVLVKIDGIAPVVNLLNHENAEVRHWAAWIVASLTHNNPTTQHTLTSQHNTLTLLCNAILKETNEKTKEKQLYALTAITSGNPPLMDQFVDSYDGIVLLASLMKSLRFSVQFKTVWFLSKLLKNRLSQNKLLLQKSSDFLKDLIEIIKRAPEGHEVILRGLEVLVVYVENDGEKVRECRELGLEEIVRDIKQHLESGDEEVVMCDNVLRLVSVC